MRVRCPECDFRVRVSDDDPDARVKCPECGERFRPGDLDDSDDEPRSRSRTGGRRPAAKADSTKLLIILGVVGVAGVLFVGLAVLGGMLFLSKRADVAEVPPAPVEIRPKLATPPPAEQNPPPFIPNEQPSAPPPLPEVPVNPPGLDSGAEPPSVRYVMPPASGQPLVSDLKVPSVKVSSEWAPGHRQVREVLPTLTWAADSKAFYALDLGANVVRRFSFPELNEEAKLAVGLEVSWLSVSKEGVVITVCGGQEAWVLDPVKLTKVRSFPVGKALRVLSAPSLGVGYACNTEERQNFEDIAAYRPHGGVLRVIDLKTGQQLKEYDVKSLDKKGALHKAVISADGKHLLAIGGMDQLQQYALDGERVSYVTTSPGRLIHGGFLQPVVSADGRLVSAPSGAGNMLVKNGHAVIDHNTYVFAPGNLNDPLLNLKTGDYPIAIGFDMKAGLIYLHNTNYHLIILDHKGTKLRSCNLVSFRLNGMNGNGVRQLLPHPDGGKLLILVAHGLNGGEATAFAVEFPKK